MTTSKKTFWTNSRNLLRGTTAEPVAPRIPAGQGTVRKPIEPSETADDLAARRKLFEAWARARARVKTAA